MTTENTIEFKNGYELFEFFNALQRLLDETFLVLEKNQMVIRCMDSSRISMLDILFKEPIYDDVITINNNKKCELGLNLEQLAKLLEVPKNSKKEISFSFDDPKHLVINKFSAISKTTKKLDIIDTLENDELPFENLESIEYKNMVLINKAILDDFFVESGDYSEIICVKFDKIGLHFIEKGTFGESEITLKIPQLKGFESDDIFRVNYESVESHYSFMFLKTLKGLIPIMTDSDSIKIELKEDTPLKITIELERLSCKLVFYLAPRVEEPDFDED